MAKTNAPAIHGYGLIARLLIASLPVGHKALQVYDQKICEVDTVKQIELLPLECVDRRKFSKILVLALGREIEVADFLRTRGVRNEQIVFFEPNAL